MTIHKRLLQTQSDYNFNASMASECCIIKDMKIRWYHLIFIKEFMLVCDRDCGGSQGATTGWWICSAEHLKVWIHDEDYTGKKSVEFTFICHWNAFGFRALASLFNLLGAVLFSRCLSFTPCWCWNCSDFYIIGCFWYVMSRSCIKGVTNNDKENMNCSFHWQLFLLIGVIS